MLEIRTPMAVLALCAVCFAPGAFAADEPAGWTDTAEFSFVATDGNAESTSLGFKNTTARKWDRSGVTFRVGGTRVETTNVDRTAVLGVVIETETTETTAENYYANGRYDRNISDTFFWYAGAGWERNEPSGVKNRYIGEGGLGNVWRDGDRMKFKTTYGVTYTDQEDVVEISGVDDTFAGARLAWDWWQKLGQTTSYTNVFVVDLNFDESSDWRANMDNGLAVAMSEKLALKLGLQFLYDNEPSFEEVPNVDGGGAPLPPVPYQLDELDTILTVSLVVDFK